MVEEYYGDILEEEDGAWLVLYDFRSRPNSRFWGNARAHLLSVKMKRPDGTVIKKGYTF